MTNQQIAAQAKDGASPIIVPWRITKARVVDGVMTWSATTSKFSRDQQGDLVTPQFYKEAIKRFKSGASPAPYFSVAHYPAQEVCECGATYKSLNESICAACGRDRLLAGISTDMWIDGKQPMAKGIFYDNELGREVYKSCRDDIERKTPYDESVRTSMGFYPDPDGVLFPAPNQRDFMKGWIEHFAGTRVPVVPEAALTVKSLSIKTRYDDAAAVVRSTTLADKLARMTGRRTKSGAEDELILKSEDKHLPGKHDQMTHASKTISALRSWRETHGVGRAQGVSEALQDMLKVDGLSDKVKASLITAGRAWGSVINRTGDEKFIEDAESKVKTAVDEYNLFHQRKRKKSLSSEEKDGGQTVETVEQNQDDSYEDKSEASEETDIALIDDPLMQDANEALISVQKAISAPGGNKAQILALAANLVSAIRDYAHTLVNTTMGEPMVPPSTMDPNDSMPANQPMPPEGQVIDETLDITKLSPTDPNAPPVDPNAPNDPNIPEELTDPNGPPTTEEDLLAEGDDAAGETAGAEEDIPEVPMPDEYLAEAATDDEETPADEAASTDEEELVASTKEASDEEPSDTGDSEGAADEADVEEPKEKKKLKFGKKPESKALRLTDLMYKHLPGQHDQKTHAGKASAALGRYSNSGSPVALEKVLFNLKGARQAKGLPASISAGLDRSIKEVSGFLNDLKKVKGGIDRQVFVDSNRAHGIERRLDNLLLRYDNWEIDLLDKEEERKLYGKSETSVGERVKERAMPNAAVKSATEHPAEVFMRSWSSGVASIIQDGQLTRRQKAEAVQKSLSEFRTGVLGLIEETTPVSNNDVDLYVKSAVEEAIVRVKVQHNTEVLQLQAKVEALTRSAVSNNVQQVIATIAGRGRLQRKSIAQPYAPVAATTPANGAPVLSGDTSVIRKSTAAEIALASVTSAQSLFR